MKLNRKMRIYTSATLALLLTAGVAGAAYLAVEGKRTEEIKVVLGDGKAGPAGMAWIPEATFMMGSGQKLSQPNERPAHKVRVSGFWMDVHDVTNAEFRRFTDATGYVTTAERKPEWKDLRVQLPPGTPKPDDSLLVPGGMVFVGTAEEVSLRDYSQWWRFVPGANWRHPQGPASNIQGKDDHPVVQVSYEDAQAYAKWAGKRLPTEAEWEFAARGGLEQADYSWGNELRPGGKAMANIWDTQQQQPFPVVRDEKIQVGTTPVGQFGANGYGLYDMAGNVWQWTADWYRSDAFQIQAQYRQPPLDPAGPAESFDPDDRGVPVMAPKRVTRGGSFLCSDTYCISYRTSARRGTDPMNGMSHLGFRTIMTVQDWKLAQARQGSVASR
jgi:formylglycine-generating enzyme required for sulfatase activity